MKKTYKNPTIKVVKMRTVQMIASSPQGYNKYLNDNPSAELGSGDKALGRQSNSFWDDEDEY